MMTSREYWIWLALALGAGARTDEILSVFSDARAIYEADPVERMVSGVFTKLQVNKLNELKPEAALHYAELCRKNGWSFVTPEDDDYPSLLLRTHNFPLVLYVWGDLSYINDSVPIGMVGTRKPCTDSIALAHCISADCARAGAVVVSGGALGIDSASHEGALSAGGKTVAVLGCGLGVNYLVSNSALREQISRSGAVISEYPPFTGVSQGSFPMRNRIISGMSFGTLVVEAGEKSGSLITASRAREQGREVYAVPGDVLLGAYSGANGLIRDGARPVKNAFELLEEYAILYPDRLDMSQITCKMPERIRQVQSEEKQQATALVELNTDGLSDDAKRLAELIGGQPIHSDELAMAVDFGFARLASALTELETQGAIVSLPGRYYKRAN